MGPGFFKPSANKVGGDSIEGICSSISTYGWGLHPNLMAACEGHDSLSWSRFKFLYLSHQQAHSVHSAGLQMLTFSENSYSRNAHGKTNPPLRGCDSNCTNKKCGGGKQPCKPCLLYKLVCCAPQRQAGRSKVVQHTKMLIRCSTKEGDTKGRGWIYAGSHNLSSSAWGSASLTQGKSTKKERTLNYKKNRTNHWELGIFLSNVVISRYENVIPWDRSNFDNTRYDNSIDVPYSSQTR